MLLKRAQMTKHVGWILIVRIIFEVLKMTNKLTDLNDHLFKQLDRLNNNDLKGEELQQEINRSVAITGVAKEVVSNASLQLNALKLKAEHQGLKAGDMPVLLIGTAKNERSRNRIHQ